MIDRIKKGWRLFEASKPGYRFRERYRRRQQSGRGTFHPSRVLYVAGGLALIAVSAFIGWLPVFGWGTVFLGLGMVAGEFEPAANLMDWLEVRARKLFRPVGRAFRRLSAWSQLAISGCVALLTLALVYGLYQVALGG